MFSAEPNSLQIVTRRGRQWWRWLAAVVRPGLAGQTLIQGCASNWSLWAIYLPQSRFWPRASSKCQRGLARKDSFRPNQICLIRPFPCMIDNRQREAWMRQALDSQTPAIENSPSFHKPRLELVEVAATGAPIRDGDTAQP